MYNKLRLRVSMKTFIIVSLYEIKFCPFFRMRSYLQDFDHFRRIILSNYDHLRLLILLQSTRGVAGGTWAPSVKILAPLDLS